MMPIHFAHPTGLLWLWVIPLFAGLFVYSAIKRNRAIQAFGGGMQCISRKREALGSCTALALILMALARPAWDLKEHELQGSGRDVIFLLDVSQSMLADDLHPNRLENAKTAILDCIEELSGDRVGLVLFAGSAEIRCPLTVDYAYFRMALRQASPESVASGGTLIAHAITRTVEKLTDPQKIGLQDLILITDGEDMVEGFDEIEAVKNLDDAGVRLIAIGLGNRSLGSRIPLEEAEGGSPSFMKHGKTEVWTKLESATLRRMTAAAADGLFFDVGQGPLDLARIYRQIMEYAPKAITSNRTREHYKEKFPLFLAGAILALLASNRWRKNP